jgi:hypothetical protein
MYRQENVPFIVVLAMSLASRRASEYDLLYLFFRCELLRFAPVYVTQDLASQSLIPGTSTCQMYLT